MNAEFTILEMTRKIAANGLKRSIARGYGQLASAMMHAHTSATLSLVALGVSKDEAHEFLDEVAGRIKKVYEQDNNYILAQKVIDGKIDISEYELKRDKEDSVAVEIDFSDLVGC